MAYLNIKPLSKGMVVNEPPSASWSTDVVPKRPSWCARSGDTMRGNLLGPLDVVALATWVTPSNIRLAAAITQPVLLPVMIYPISRTVRHQLRSVVPESSLVTYVSDFFGSFHSSVLLINRHW